MHFGKTESKTKNLQECGDMQERQHLQKIKNKKWNLMVLVQEKGF